MAAKRKGLFTIHGSFSSKADAKRRERKVGGFIRKTKSGKFIVLKPR